MRRTYLALLLVAAIAAPVAADPTPVEPKKLDKRVKVRTANASATKIGFTAHGLPCEGLARYRSGMGSSQAALELDGGVSPVVMYQVWSQQQTGALLASQAIAAIGVRQKLGAGWIQGGPGIAHSATHRGPRSVGIMKTVEQARPALAGGVGMNVDMSGDEPASLALDFGRTIGNRDGEESVYQVGASMVQRF